MVTRTFTVAFEGVEARLVEVQCALSPGLPAFSVVGLPDKAVSEAKERVRAALTRAIGEFGAVSVVSGSIRGETLSLPLQIELLEQDYNTVGSFTAAALLTLMAILTLFLKSMVQWRLANQEKRAQLEGNHEH